MAEPTYALKLPYTVNRIGAPGGTVRLPTTVVPDPLETALFAAMPAGSIWLQAGVQYDTVAGTWGDRKSGVPFSLVSGAMAAPVIDAAHGNMPYVPWPVDSVFASPLGVNVWPTDSDYTMVMIMGSSGSASGMMAGNGRIDTSTTAGVRTGHSYGFRYAVTDSVLGFNEQTYNAAGSAGTVAMIQTATGAAPAPDPHLWVMSRDYAGNAARIRKDATEIRAVTGFTRKNEDSRLIIGAGGWDGTTFVSKARNIKCYAAFMVRGIAEHKTGTGNEAAVAFKSALNAWANAKFALGL